MSVLVLGAAGMAGHVVSLYLRENGFTVDTLSARHALDENTYMIDVTDSRNFTNFLDTHSYDAIINCIGLLVKPSEIRKDLAIYLNSYLPHFLENYYQDKKTKVITIGSNGVFSGEKPSYQENDHYDGDSFYSRTKSLGEIINSKDLTFRTSIIGPDLRADSTSLFNWFCTQRGDITGYTNVLWNGTTTVELAKSVKAAIEQDISGVYHLVPKNSISKFALLELLKSTFGRKDVTIKPGVGSVLGITLINTRKDLHHVVPDYETTITDMKLWIAAHPNLYKHYLDI